MQYLISFLFFIFLAACNLDQVELEEESDTTSLSSTSVSRVDLANGNSHSCVLLRNGEVKCWGYNKYGQTGGSDNNDTSISTVDIFSNSQVIALAAGAFHNCVLLENGDVECWGYNKYGQTGGLDKSATAMVTVDLGANQRAKAISASSFHTCALLDGGEAKCWGSNGFGQTGGSDKSATGIVTVDLGANQRAKVIETGQFHTCAILDNGDATEGGPVKCWGSNTYGQTGGSDKSATGMVAVNLGANRKALSISLNATHSCAILDNGMVNCWGNNGFRQTGGSDRSATSIVAVNLGTNYRAIAISAGYLYTCAILETKEVKCWGYNSSGQTGGSDKSATGIVNVNLGGDSHSAVIDIDTGYAHTCVLLSEDAVKCWGSNSYNQAGDSDKSATGQVDINLEL